MLVQIFAGIFHATESNTLKMKQTGQEKPPDGARWEPSWTASTATETHI